MWNRGHVAPLIALGVFGAAMLVSRPGIVLANRPEVIDTGACLVPVTSSVIQLVSEHVVVRVPKNNGTEGHVVCAYELRNPSSRPFTITMAFVVGTKGRLEGVAGLFEDSHFTVRADGIDVPARMQATREKD